MALRSMQYYKDILAKHGGKTFYQREREREKLDPGNKTYHAAVDYAQSTMNRFMNQVRDSDSPGHEAALNKYLKQYGQDENKVADDHLSVACALLDAAPFEEENSAYVRNLLNGYALSTPDDRAFFDKFTKMLKAKLEAEGNRDMDQFVADFWKAHPLSESAKLHTKKVIDGKAAVNLVHPAADPNFNPANPPKEWRTFDADASMQNVMAGIHAKILARNKK